MKSKKRILLIDNYDSFVYNITHAIEKMGYEVDVVRNDKITIDEVGKYDKILLSPGPGIPTEAGIMCDVIRRYGAEKSIFGICLGEQAIGEVYGATLTNLSNVFHGVATKMEVIAEDPIFEGVEESFEAGRYHSWCVSSEGLPEEIIVTAVDGVEGRIMAIRHRDYDVRGVQFHPESVMTAEGDKIISNWLKM
ncbi:MAG: aminodeoxychorismate/anthranilate synthase component II [Rikenellaceae bacterium]